MTILKWILKFFWTFWIFVFSVLPKSMPDIFRTSFYYWDEQDCSWNVYINKEASLDSWNCLEKNLLEKVENPNYVLVVRQVKIPNKENQEIGDPEIR